jgi:hypothetical protein
MLPASTMFCVVILQIFIRLEGLGAVVKQQLMQDRSFNVTQLVNMLQQLKIPTKPSEHVHVELLVRVQSKVVLVHHANESTLNTLFKGENRQINYAFFTRGETDGMERSSFGTADTALASKILHILWNLQCINLFTRAHQLSLP